MTNTGFAELCDDIRSDAHNAGLRPSPAFEGHLTGWQGMSAVVLHIPEDDSGVVEVGVFDFSGSDDESLSVTWFRTARGEAVDRDVVSGWVRDALLFSV